ncbi:MAG: hypothetical protein ACXWUG_12560 [Polyangiales bacterium]
MAVAGTFPEAGVRVALDLVKVDDAIARYQGNAYTPWARHDLELDVDVKTGTATLHVRQTSARDDGAAPPSRIDPPPSMESGDLAFVRQLGKQLWRLATQDPELKTWPRRIQRWRGPK